MADTVFPLGSIPAATLLSEDLLSQALYTSVLARFIGDDDDAMVRILPDLTRRAGDTIDYELELNLVGPGVLGFDELQGNEEPIIYLPDAFSINDIAHAVSIRGQMTLQRVPWSMRKRAKRLLQKWLTRRMDVTFANQLGGNTAGAGLGIPGVAAGDLRFLGMNATQAPSSVTTSNGQTVTRQVFPTSISAESGLTSAGTNGANQFQLYQINQCVTKAESAVVPIRPIIVNGEPYYVLFAHPFQVNDLKNLTGNGTWQSIQLAAMAGTGQDYVKDNPLFTGAMGMYNRCIIHKDMHVPFGDTAQASASAKLGTSLGAAGNGTTSVARAIFCGANAGVIAFGRHTSWPSQVKWVEMSQDYNRKLGVSCELIFGMKKSWFTTTGDSGATDFGTIVVSTWANAA